MFNFSVFIEDYAGTSTFDERIEICRRLNIANMETGDVFGGTPLTELTGAEIEKIRNSLIANHAKIVMINSSRSPDDYRYHTELLARAHVLRAENIKLDTDFDESTGLAEISAHIQKLVPAAEAYGIGLQIENKAQSPLSNDRAMTELYRSTRSEQIGVIFNPLEYVRTKAHPFFHAFYNSKLKGAIRFLRLNDGLFADGSETAPGQGNAELKEMASILLSRSYPGYFSIAVRSSAGDSAGIEAEKALDAFKNMLMEL